jgi:hypothetical protein
MNAFLEPQAYNVVNGVMFPGAADFCEGVGGATAPYPAVSMNRRSTPSSATAVSTPLR